MTPAEVVRERILAISAVTALIGSRCYSVIFPQKPTWPSARVQDINEIEDLHLRGSVGVIEGLVQVEVISGQRTAVSALSEAKQVMALIHGATQGFAAGIATGLLGWSGSIGSPAVTVDVVRPAGYREFYEDISATDRVWRVQRDYRVTIRAH